MFLPDPPINPCLEVSMISKLVTQLPNEKTYLSVWEGHHLQTYDQYKWVRDYMGGLGGA